MPSGSLFTTLRQSSIQPIVPKPKVTSITTQTKRLLQSNHNTVETPMAIRISAPPIVGVPRLARCDCMPYSRIGWPIFNSARRRITHGPNARPISSAVIAASTARKVRNWKTRRKPSASGYIDCNHWARLSSISSFSPAGPATTRSICMKREPLTSNDATAGSSLAAPTIAGASSKCRAPAPNARTACAHSAPAHQNCSMPRSLA